MTYKCLAMHSNPQQSNEDADMFSKAMSVEAPNILALETPLPLHCLNIGFFPGTKLQM